MLGVFRADLPEVSRYLVSLASSLALSMGLCLAFCLNLNHFTKTFQPPVLFGSPAILKNQLFCGLAALVAGFR